MMKTTRFHAIHTQNGAKMVSFAGFEMPIQYPAGIIAEHMSVRTHIGVFDVSHMGEVEIRGPQALDFVQKISINDASKLVPNKAQYSAMCYPDGGIIDDMLVYHRGDHYMLVINGACAEKDIAWMHKQAQGMDVTVHDVSDEINLLAVQGPKSLEALQTLTDVNLSEIPYYGFADGTLAGLDMIISRTGYTGELGFELYFRGDESVCENVWKALFEAGSAYGMQPIGLGARDTLRLEKGYCLYGNDISKDTNPLEAGLGWITKLAKGTFNGSEAIAKVKEQGPTRKLIAFKVLAEKFIARQQYPIHHGGNPVGEVTSGNISPILNVGIGLGYVPTSLAEPGTIIQISARGKEFDAEVVKLPFV
ncbi:MAG: glycine cleavage system aminomethyltransferase GcvT [Ignavibacteria bacterium]